MLCNRFKTGESNILESALALQFPTDALLERLV
jgi:hypothetical protein